MDHMDSSRLVFSLSNHSLYHPIFPDTTSSAAVVDPDDANGADHGLPGLSAGGPKLEDFLGGPGASSSVVQYDGGDVGMYHGSELKSIAATFLRGFSTDQTHKQITVAPPPAKKAAAETFGQRTSIFRGVTRHRWTGRYEAHLWDNTCRREGQSRKGRQVYLGGYDKEEKAARAYDLAALKYWGPTTTTNFPVSDYEREMEEMKHMTRQEFVASLRRKSSGFSRGASIYRGVTRHHQHGRWQARIGRVAGNKDLYLGTFGTQEEAAEAYDIAAIKFRGLNAVTNFDMCRYDVKSIATNNLPVGGASTTKPKTTSDSLSDNKSATSEDGSKDPYSATSSIPFQSPPAIDFGLPAKHDQQSCLWAALGYPNIALAMSESQSPSNSIVLLAGCATPFGVEYCASENSGEGLYGEGGYYHGSSGTTSMSRMVSSEGTTHDAVGSGSWVQPSVHAFQGTKSNLASFQTPIFGME